MEDNQQLRQYRRQQQSGDDGYDEYVDANYPVGFRFVPTDMELIKYYLRVKELGLKLPPNRIPVVALYDHHPQNLTGMYRMNCEKAWYFFTRRNRKYPNGTRPNRKAADGIWKPTNKDEEILLRNPISDEIIYDQNQNKIILGYKRPLDYCVKKGAEWKKTEWKMTEYLIDRTSTLPNTSNGGNAKQLDKWALCKLYWNTRAKANNEEAGGRPRTPIPSAPPAPVAGHRSSGNQNISNSTDIYTPTAYLQPINVFPGQFISAPVAGHRSSGNQNISSSTNIYTPNAYLQPINGFPGQFISEPARKRKPVGDDFDPSSSRVDPMQFTMGTTSVWMGSKPANKPSFDNDEIRFLHATFGIQEEDPGKLFLL